MLLDNAAALHKRMDCVMHVKGGRYSSLPATKVDKKTMHQSTSTAGDKEVGGKKRR
jgi:hypothetical protein